MFLGLLKYHLLVLFREPLNLFFGFGLPFIQLILLSGQLRGDDSGDIVARVLPVFVIVAAMVLSFTDAALSHGYTRQIKFLRRLRMTPVKPFHYIATGIISRIGVLFLFTAVFTTVAVGVFGSDISNKNWPLFIGVMLLMFIMFYLIGMFIANVMRTAKTSQNLIYVVFFGMLAIGGFWFPVEAMPEILQTIVDWLPTTFAISSLNAAWMRTDLMYGHYFIMLLASIALFGTLSIKFFKYE